MFTVPACWEKDELSAPDLVNRLCALQVFSSLLSSSSALPRALRAEPWLRGSRAWKADVSQHRHSYNPIYRVLRAIAITRYIELYEPCMVSLLVLDLAVRAGVRAHCAACARSTLTQPQGMLMGAFLQ